MMITNAEFHDEVPELGVLDPARQGQHSTLGIVCIAGLELLKAEYQAGDYIIHLSRVSSFRLLQTRSWKPKKASLEMTALFASFV